MSITQCFYKSSVSIMVMSSAVSSQFRFLPRWWKCCLQL